VDIQLSCSTGVTGYQRVNSQVTVNPGVSRTHGVACPAGKRIMGGGYSVASTAGKIYASEPSGVNAWVSGLRNTSGVARTLTVYAVCTSVSNALSVVAQAITVTPFGGTASTITVCEQSNKWQPMGGWSFTPTTANLLVRQAQRWSTNGWLFEWQYPTNPGGPTVTLRLSRICWTL
jgi:hypothetical protein